MFQPADLATIRQFSQTGPFTSTWDSLKAYETPLWYQDAKFGIFIHWGVYSVPAFGNEWYPREMYLPESPHFAHHQEKYGSQKDFGYKDFIPQFTAEHFDPDAWATLFRRAGAQYIVPVAEHHDGFAMYDCSFSEWKATTMGPKRDVIGELAEAVRRQWMTFGLSSHRAEHWWFFDGGMAFDSDVQDTRNLGLYGPAQPDRYGNPNEAFLEDWLLRTCELIDRYQPQLIYFDWWIEQPAFKPYLPLLAAYYYNRAAEWRRGVVINYKNTDSPNHAFPEGAAVFDVERGQLSEISPRFWQSDTTVSHTSWGYVSNHDYKPVASLIGDLVDVVSKNGGLLLNIGPRPDGTIAAQEERILLEFGQWLHRHAAAIYSSRPWKIFGEGPTKIAAGQFTDAKREPFTSRDIRFTTRGDDLYATVMAWPEDGRVSIRALGSDSTLWKGDIGKVQLLGTMADITWRREPEALIIDLPATEATTPLPVLHIQQPK